ncbi:MAG: hypothetical protein PVI45_14240, partial [Desulfobacterales bacterium]
MRKILPKIKHSLHKFILPKCHNDISALLFKRLSLIAWFLQIADRTSRVLSVQSFIVTLSAEANN